MASVIAYFSGASAACPPPIPSTPALAQASLSLSRPRGRAFPDAWRQAGQLPGRPSSRLRPGAHQRMILTPDRLVPLRAG